MADFSEMFTFIILMAVLVLVVGGFIKICVGLRKGGGSLTTVILGATDEFLSHDRSKAAETIVNENAGKKFEEQRSSDPKLPTSATDTIEGHKTLNHKS